MHKEGLDKWDIFAISVFNSPALIGAIAAFGYIAHVMVSDNKSTRRKIIGGVLMALYVGYISYFLAIALGFSQEIAAPCSILLGSTSEAGYLALMDRAKRILKIGEYSE